MLTQGEIEAADAFMKERIAAAETNRRERPSVSTTPIDGVMDYAQSGSVMELAMAHLRESIPSGQRLRTMNAWLAMKEAVKHQELWLRQRGFL
jgi:hypothetical protein